MIDCDKLYWKHHRIYNDLVMVGSTYPMDKLLNTRIDIGIEYESVIDECSFEHRQLIQRILLLIDLLMK